MEHLESAGVRENTVGNPATRIVAQKTRSASLAGSVVGCYFICGAGGRWDKQRPGG
jgi:hypothetical protein